MQKKVEAERKQKQDITLSDGSIISMRRPKTADMIAVGDETNPIKMQAMLISNVCMMTLEEVGDLDIDDFKTLAGKSAAFDL